jgi:hypothetical protein
MPISNGSENDGYYNVYYGFNAGNSLTSDAEYNSFFGYYTGRYNTSGDHNTFMGNQAGYNTTTSHNTFIGSKSGYTNTTGYFNTLLGFQSGYKNTSGYQNVFIGKDTGYENTTGNYNTFIGIGAGGYNTTGNHNSYLGSYSGENATGSYNVFLGSLAGIDEGGSNKLYIENSSSSSPLIYGEFDNDLIKINGNFRVTGYLSLDNGTTQINSTELNLLDGRTSIATGTSNNDVLVTKGYVDENDDVGGGGLTGDQMSDSCICKWDDGNTRLVDSIMSETPGDVNVDGYISTKYFKQRSVAPQMRWYETDGPDPSDFFKMNYHNSSLEFIWYDASSATTYFPIKMEGDGYVGINNTNPTHMLDVGTSGAYCNGGAWVDGSSIEFKENVRSLNAEDARKTLDGLNPVIYNYKQDKEEEHLGFIAEEVPELVAMKDRKGLSAMDVVSVLTKVVQDQQKKIRDQQEIIINQNNINKKHYKLFNNLLKRIEYLEQEK